MSPATDLAPDRMIAIPPISHRATERWTVLLWRGDPCRARFMHATVERTTSQVLHWADGAWLEPVPVAIPAALAARAHRQLKQLQRMPDEATEGPAARLRSIDKRRRAMAASKTPRLLRP